MNTVQIQVVLRVKLVVISIHNIIMECTKCWSRIGRICHRNKEVKIKLVLKINTVGSEGFTIIITMILTESIKILLINKSNES